MKRIIALFFAAVMAVSCFSTTLYAETDTGQTEDTETVAPPETDYNDRIINLPNNMRAAIITPSVDYYTDPEADKADIKAELEAIYVKFASIGLNTVIINTVYEDKAFYSVDMNAGSEVFDITSLAVETAYNHGVSPYLVFDLSHAMLDCKKTTEPIDHLVSKTHRFTMKYPSDGIILDDYYVRRNAESYGSYMENGSGIGYTNWLYDTAEQYFKTAADIVKMTNNSVAVGFIATDIWANSETNENGSATTADVQALYDGYSDTKAFIEKGYIDFAIIRAYGSLGSIQLPFDEVTGWWDTVTSAAEIPMYVIHHNERIGTYDIGWRAEDQLLRQLTVAKKLDSYGGSIFNSYESLLDNPLGTTTTITSYFNQQINEESLFEDLKMTSPAKLNFTTSEQTVTFMGSFDSNFPVYFNNKKIELNDAGNFYFTKDLSVGMNTFTIEHKAKTYTYKIERKIIVMTGIDSAIEEGKTLNIDGGTKITLSATAYKGAEVYGYVNGQAVKLTEATVIGDNDDINSTYVRYTGTYTAPEGIIGQAQDLGKIKITASYLGYNMEAIGAKVVVNAKPEPVIEQDSVIIDSNTVGTGEVVGTIESIFTGAETIDYVKVNENYTIVYDGKTADNIPSPLFSQLPAGTIEPYKATSGSYYITQSGKRLAMSTASLISDSGIADNPLFVKSVGTKNGESYIKLTLKHKTSFNMVLAGNSYYTGWDGDYNVSNFTATHLYITFENVTSVTKLPSFENNLVFKSGKWDTVTEENGTKFRLILELRQPGVYFGHGAEYNGDGDLVLFFPVPINSLSGLTVVIDPGHGYGKYETIIDPGAIGEIVEFDANLAIAKELETALRNAGANVVRLKTESEFILTKQRPIYARAYGGDIYISIHANKATATAKGCEAYYFTSYSQPLASAISSSIGSYLTNNVYTDGKNADRGPKYSYYHVTLHQDFPSVLVETGFVSNIEDAMALADPTHQKGIANAIVSGIKSYISRSTISSATNGSTNVENPSEGTGTTTAPESTETPEESPDSDASDTTAVPESTQTS